MLKQKLLIMAAVLVWTSSCSVQNQANVDQLQTGNVAVTQSVSNTSVNYADKSNWMYLSTKPKHEVDLIYFYPTATIDSPDGSGIGEINDKNKKNAKDAFARSGSAFSGYTNVFAPYYRQVTAKVAAKAQSLAEYKEYVRNSQAKIDAFAALDYYFKNLNNGRPFMISSHSQGSVIAQLAFEEYFSEHPEYLDRMVAAYVVGFPITKEWLEQNNLKFAQGETDTGVVISWFVEGPDAVGGSIGDALSINPVNWKSDETPASIKENKGSVDYKTLKVGKGVADATLNLERGTVVCTTRNDYLPDNPLFGNKSFHINDYAFYHENIKENGRKRVEAYLGHKAK